MRKITELTQTCGACPEQYEGKLEDGSEVYIRCRWGSARIDINGETVATMDVGDSLQGIFEDGQLEELIDKANLGLATDIIK